jgi:hypothetical protein
MREVVSILVSYFRFAVLLFGSGLGLGWKIALDFFSLNFVELLVCSCFMGLKSVDCAGDRVEVEAI